MKVALVAHRYPPALGGVERHVAEIAHGLVEHGVEVDVITTDPTRRLPPTEVDRGVVVRRFPTVANDAVFYVSPWLGTWLARNSRRYDVLHAHSYHTPLAFQALVAARLAGRPFVLTPHYHGTGHSPLRRLLHVPYRLLGGFVVRGSRPLICVSNAERMLLQRRFGADLPVVVAPNGVDVEGILQAEPFGTERRHRLVLAAGRIEAYKQVDRTVEAIAALGGSDELVVLGTGPAEDAVARRAAELGVADRVRLLGHVSTAELHRWLRTADAFVSMSRNEAFGITLLEAGVAGAGVVASDIPAHREVAELLPTGRVRLVSVDAPPAEVAAAVRRATRREISHSDAARIPTWRETVERTLGAYRIALSRGARTPAHHEQAA